MHRQDKQSSILSVLSQQGLEDNQQASQEDGLKVNDCECDQCLLNSNSVRVSVGNNQCRPQGDGQKTTADQD